MTLYLTDRTSAAEIERATPSGAIVGCKLYPAGATTHSDAGVTDIARLEPALAAMTALDLPLLVHGEVTDPRDRRVRPRGPIHRARAGTAVPSAGRGCASCSST